MIWLVNLNKCIVNAKGLSVAINKEDPDFPNTLRTDCHIELNKKINNNGGYDLVPKVTDYGSRAIKVLAVLTGLRKQDLHWCKNNSSSVIPTNGKEEKRVAFCSREDDS